MWKAYVACAGVGLSMAFGAQADTVPLRVLGQPVGSGLIQQKKEQPFFEALAANTGQDFTVQYLPVDVAGIPDTDGLRVLRSGLFDIVSLRGSQVSRDEPTLMGADLVGLNTSFEEGKRNVEAYFSTVDERLQKSFNAKLLGLWPAGPQIIFCKPQVAGLADLKGLKVRVGDQNTANFMSSLGATGVPMPFGEVQQSLARGVVDCAITGPASANSGGWPEAASTALPIALQMAVNGYAINLKRWNSLNAEQQAALERAVGQLSSDIWTYSEQLYDDAMRCNAGEQPCELGQPYKLNTLVAQEQDLQAVKQALRDTSLPVWAKQCNAVNKECETKWQDTIGKQLGW
ncbi:TRAP transporter substrate-binding protein [Alcaligenes endophyticus]|uniref:TRAP transporter substrate-binding protein n=1 Tax=Alcaligenes endophyticus TaxID=1929088 RepID=A0ABT8EM41_9BURK|nr:TRAP transporter substrate-binding protein [Alcaligenes endophyticus]MCX5591064.1 TRAP transporter substrate-binding protein [Alcaligenes endophyticus]MDN4122358.1 TRAP transporter substrate-binding protein [Alcaligenes endophyticus]